MKHVVSYSGGAGSWCAAKRVADQYGTDNLVLLFADTLIEDADLYRFLHESAANIGVPITRIADGRTPWELFKDKNFVANHLVDSCSHHLKRTLLDKWRKDNCDPADTIVYVGIDWTESHRIERIRAKEKVWNFQAPLCDAPYLNKCDIFAMLKDEGIEPPNLYKMGFPHNNCGGFCVKAGHAQFALLLKTMPDRFAWHEQ
jgi:3'-phosphoadenosine 5'-phosphosulfate sulfotransferase (PAPS reductase)/FAD synthetase